MSPPWRSLTMRDTFPVPGEPSPFFLVVKNGSKMRPINSGGCLARVAVFHGHTDAQIDGFDGDGSLALNGLRSLEMWLVPHLAQFVA